MIPVVILAAGRSRRMRGRDKLLEDIDGVPLLVRQVEMALGLGGDVFVALSPEDRARKAALAGLACRLLIVPEAEEGLSGTLRGAVAQLPEAPAFMVFLGDLVALETADLRQLYEAYLSNPAYLIWRGATADGKAGHPIIFSAAVRPRFADLSGDDGAARIVGPLQKETCLIRLRDDRARRDLDTPEDWAAWRKTRR